MIIFWKKNFFFLALAIFIGIDQSQAQTRSEKKLAKQQAKQKEILDKALQRRYEDDSRYASGKRAAFNRSSWVGGKLSDLIQSWGPPARVVEDGAGGKIAVYEKRNSHSGGTYTPGYIETATNGFGQTVITGSKEAVDTRWSSTYSEATVIYADQNGTITKVTFDNDYQRN